MGITARSFVHSPAAWLHLRQGMVTHNGTVSDFFSANRGVTMVKLLVYLRRRPDLTREQFRQYWRETHGPLVKGVGEFTRHIRRYVQYDPIEAKVSGFPVELADVDGIAEVIFDSVEEIAAAYQEPRYMEIIRPDEFKFLELQACTLTILNEVVMYER
jgi:uncharacterized protein (TIGR02118 family)